jgi:hypothetical protein
MRIITNILSGKTTGSVISVTVGPRHEFAFKSGYKATSECYAHLQRVGILVFTLMGHHIMDTAEAAEAEVKNTQSFTSMFPIHLNGVWIGTGSLPNGTR